MNHNDVLRRIRYALNITDLRVIELFALAGRVITRTELEPFFLKEEDAGYVECPDEILGLFLDGLIVSRRGKREAREGSAVATAAPAGNKPGPANPPGPIEPPPRLSNNEILKRLRIALELKDEDIIAIMAQTKVKVSKSELSAFFRKQGHVNLAGLTAKYRV